MVLAGGRDATVTLPPVRPRYGVAVNRPHFKVCPFYHDHPEGDPSYDDCMVAYEDAKARLAPKPVGAAEIDAALPHVVAGRRYRVVYRNRTQRIDHYSVVDALSEMPSYYVWSARPVLGTQEMPKAWIKSITEVHKTTPIVVGKTVRSSDFT